MHSEAVTVFSQCMDARQKPERIKTVDALASILVRSQLSTQQQVEELTDRFQKRHQESRNDVTEFSSYLVGCGVLTAWQCEKLRNGQWKGFFDCPGFVILDQLSAGERLLYCLARSTDDNRLARISIAPPPNYPECRVEEWLD